MRFAVSVCGERRTINEYASYSSRYSDGKLHRDSSSALGLSGYVFGRPTVTKKYDIGDEHVADKQFASRQCSTGMPTSRSVHWQSKHLVLQGGRQHIVYRLSTKKRVRHLLILTEMYMHLPFSAVIRMI